MQWNDDRLDKINFMLRISCAIRNDDWLSSFMKNFIVNEINALKYLSMGGNRKGYKSYEISWFN